MLIDTVDWDLMGEDDNTSYKDILQLMKDNSSNIDWFISGSYAVNEYMKQNDFPERNFSDIDFYFENKKSYKKAVKLVEKTYKGIDEMTSINATSFMTQGYPVQFICKHFGTPKKVLKTFDLNTSKCWVDTKMDAFASKDFNPTDVEFSDLVKNEFSLGTVYRFIKYVNKGYAYKDKTFKFMIDKIMSNEFIPKSIATDYSEDSQKHTIEVGRFIAICALAEVKKDNVAKDLHNLLPDFKYHDPVLRKSVIGLRKDNEIMSILSPSYWFEAKYAIYLKRSPELRNTVDTNMYRRVIELYPELVV